MRDEQFLWGTKETFLIYGCPMLPQKVSKFPKKTVPVSAFIHYSTTPANAHGPNCVDTAFCGWSGSSVSNSIAKCWVNMWKSLCREKTRTIHKRKVNLISKATIILLITRILYGTCISSLFSQSAPHNPLHKDEQLLSNFSSNLRVSEKQLFRKPSSAPRPRSYAEGAGALPQPPYVALG